MRGIEWGGSRRLTAFFAVLVLMAATALPAVAAKPDSNQGKAKAASEEPVLVLESSTSDQLALSEPSYVEAGSLFDVARRIGLVDLSGAALMTVAMIDTGVVDVPGLRHSNVTIGPDFSFEDIDSELRGRDANGHGTHLAGIVVGSDAAWASGDTVRGPDRTIGIAPDATLLSVKAGASNGATDVTQVIAAVNWVVLQHVSGSRDVDVLLLAYSAGGDVRYTDDPLVLALERAWRAGITVVVSAGNEGRDAWSLTSPARAPFLIAVGATENADNSESTSKFTNSGLMRAPDLHAPGKSIISLRNPGSFSDQFNDTGRVGDDLVRATGTSQAAAVVAGGAALLIEQRPDLTPDQVKATLMAGSDLIGRSVGWPMLALDVGASLATTTIDEDQYYGSITGDGPLDELRGNAIVEIDGVPLTGDQDIFGVDYSDSKWTTDSWTGHSWSGHSWSADSWQGHSWSGHSWSTDMWAGHSWSGHTWSGHSWSGHTWSGHTWSGVRWS